jgi:hypothetical protein
MAFTESKDVTVYQVDSADDCMQGIYTVAFLWKPYAFYWICACTLKHHRALMDDCVA